MALLLEAMGNKHIREAGSIFIHLFPPDPLKLKKEISKFCVF